MFLVCSRMSIALERCNLILLRTSRNQNNNPHPCQPIIPDGAAISSFALIRELFFRTNEIFPTPYHINNNTIFNKQYKSNKSTSNTIHTFPCQNYMTFFLTYSGLINNHLTNRIPKYPSLPVRFFFQPCISCMLSTKF